MQEVSEVVNPSKSPFQKLKSQNNNYLYCIWIRGSKNMIDNSVSRENGYFGRLYCHSYSRKKYFSLRGWWTLKLNF